METDIMEILIEKNLGVIDIYWEFRSRKVHGISILYFCLYLRQLVFQIPVKIATIISEIYRQKIMKKSINKL